MTNLESSAAGSICTYSDRRAVSKSNVADWSKYCCGSKMYTDKTFPPNNFSLYWTKYPRKIAEGDVKTTKKYVKGWARIKVLNGGKTPSLWGYKGPSPQATHQGVL